MTHYFVYFDFSWCKCPFFTLRIKSQLNLSKNFSLMSVQFCDQIISFKWTRLILNCTWVKTLYPRKNYEFELISSDYRLNRQVRQSRRNLTWTLSKSLGEKMIVQQNYTRIKNLVKLLIESGCQKNIEYEMHKKLVIANLLT